MKLRQKSAPKKVRAPRSVRWKILTFFSLFIVITILLLWLCNTFFLDDIYRSIKKVQMLRTADEIAVSLKDGTAEDTAASLTQKYELWLSSYLMYGNTDGLEVLSERYQSDSVIGAISRESCFALYRQAKQNGGTVFGEYATDNRQTFPGESKRIEASLPQSLILARSTEINGQNYLILLGCFLTPMAAASQTVNVLLILISLLLVLLTVLLAFLLSRKIARPIQNISRGAARLGAREYDLQLCENGYAEVARLSDALNHAGKELSQVDDLCRELISNISHDLRTPLTMITGYAEIMRDLPGENTPENVQVIIDEANRLTSLVNDVLDLSKFSTGRQQIEPSRFNLTETLRQALLRYGKMAEQKGYQIEFRFGSDVTVYTDENRFLQAFFNLVNNALTYTDDSMKITVCQTLYADHVRVSVTDYGDGIPEDQLPLIFDRYYRASSSHRRPAVGTGLGLAIVRTVMEHLGGSCGVSSKVGHGATFYLDLPLSDQRKDS